MCITYNILYMCVPVPLAVIRGRAVIRARVPVPVAVIRGRLVIHWPCAVICGAVCPCVCVCVISWAVGTRSPVGLFLFAIPPCPVWACAVIRWPCACSCSCSCGGHLWAGGHPLGGLPLCLCLCHIVGGWGHAPRVGLFLFAIPPCPCWGGAVICWGGAVICAPSVPRGGRKQGGAVIRTPLPCLAACWRVILHFPISLQPIGRGLCRVCLHNPNMSHI